MAPYAELGLTVAEALAFGAAGAENPSSLFMPGGNPVGWVEGGADGIRTVFRSEFDQIAGKLISQAEQGTPPGTFRGSWYKLANGGEFGLRNSAANGLTLELKNVPGVSGFNKIHQIPNLVDMIPR